MEQINSSNTVIENKTPVSIIACKDGGTIAYEFIPGNSPGVIFFPGLHSDMNGAKASAFRSFCKQKKQAFLRFDYRGHGKSSGNFEDFTIGDWVEDALYVLDNLTFGPQIVIGSSMGGWIMLLAALKRPERIVSLLGLAPAPDFTEDLIWSAMTCEQKLEMEKKGYIDLPNCYDEKKPYRITHKLVLEGRKHLLLGKEIKINVPVHLIHGLDDQDVPFETSQRLSEKLSSNCVDVTLVKSGDHRLSDEVNLRKAEHVLMLFLRLFNTN